MLANAHVPSYPLVAAVLCLYWVNVSLVNVVIVNVLLLIDIIFLNATVAGPYVVVLICLS